MSLRRVVVTGIGMITPVGTGRENVWSALCAGKSGISRIEKFDTSSLKSKIAGICREFQPLDYFSEREQGRLDRSSQLAIAATMLAAEDGRFKSEDFDNFT